jgi:hypothetical protein
MVTGAAKEQNGRKRRAKKGRARMENDRKRENLVNVTDSTTEKVGLTKAAKS